MNFIVEGGGIWPSSETKYELASTRPPPPPLLQGESEWRRKLPEALFLWFPIAFNKMNPALGNYEVASTTISIWVVPGVIVKGKAH